MAIEDAKTKALESIMQRVRSAPRDESGRPVQTTWPKVRNAMKRQSQNGVMVAWSRHQALELSEDVEAIAAGEGVLDRVVRGSRMRLYLAHGGRVDFVVCTPDAAERLRGYTFDWVYVDESLETEPCDEPSQATIRADDPRPYAYYGAQVRLNGPEASALLDPTDTTHETLTTDEPMDLTAYADRLSDTLGCPVVVGDNPHLPPGYTDSWIEKVDAQRFQGLHAASESRLADGAATFAHIRAQRAQADLVASIRSEWDNLPDAEPEGIVLRPR
jgi:hypothetical protein